jgi:apolipoprotein N-acyltransferase
MKDGGLPALIRRRILVALLGAVCVLGFAPFGWFPVPVVAMAILVAMLQPCTPRQAAVTGFWFGAGFFLAGVSWVYVSLHDFGGMLAPVAILFTTLFCLYLALFPALAGFLSAQVKGPAAALLAFPAAWTLAEWTRGWLFSGFPWLSMGYSQMAESPLRHFAPLSGVFGVTLAMTLCSGALAIMAFRWRTAGWRAALRSSAAPLLAVVLAVGVGGGFAHWTQPQDNGAVSVALVQGNIPQDIKWQPERAASTLKTYQDMTLASRARLTLLPETALPLFQVELPPGYLEVLGAQARRQDGDLLYGIPEIDGSGAFYNSVMSTGTSSPQIYRKSHLVPFGDYFPMQSVLGWIMRLMEIPMSSFSHGDPAQRPLQVAGQRVAINICYEDAFGDEVIRQLPEASLLANFTNDAWWGRSIASEQHLQMAQMRALESGRYMLRATNTGVTAIIDANGRIRERAPEFSATTLTGLAQGYEGATPYVKTGNVAVILLAAVLYLAALGWSRRTAHPSRATGPL